MAEPATGAAAAKDAPVLEKTPTSEPDEVGEVAATPPVSTEDETTDVDADPIVNRAVEVDEDVPPSYADVTGQAEKSTPDASVVDEATADRALPTGPEDQPLATVAGIEPASGTPAVVEGEEGVLADAARDIPAVGRVEVPVAEAVEDKPTVVVSSDAPASEDLATGESVDEAGVGDEDDVVARVDSVHATPDTLVDDGSCLEPSAVDVVQHETVVVDAAPVVGATDSATSEVTCILMYSKLVVA